ncbi:alpha/beta fold hydrolase [Sneathiella sp. P13V-1]|uniref:alpha/beta hydrolase n=1 Tax=Sneathiella sp. P13V-1 TaxID=2697366 RepID=UPI00187B2739|nr:alpha/beta hydrolase [Sneathiella sp. P13V-1]MBE7637924.1 alpha/beta fold hydrolase [Sneathiella sp. P13V-1]
MGSFKLTANDGLALHIYEWLPNGSPKAVVQIAHGMAEHAARYERLALFLNEAGIAVYANDHRGHGKTIPEGNIPGHMADEKGWEKAVEDLHLINREIAARHPETPIMLMGHSMGSFMTQDYLARYSDTLAGAALSATNGPPGTLGKLAQLVSRIEKLRNGNEGHSTLLANMSFKAFNKAFAPNRTEFDWLSRDEAEVDKYVNDPLCGYDCSIATWIGLLDALTRIASDDALAKMNKELPIYVFSGTDDPVGEKTKGVERLIKAYKKRGFGKVTLKYYPDGRHELLNETNRDEVMTDLLGWVEDVIANS